KRRRFRHSAPRLSSISDAWGRLNVVTPFHHLSEDSHLHRSLGAGPITASSSQSDLEGANRGEMCELLHTSLVVQEISMRTSHKVCEVRIGGQRIRAAAKAPQAENFQGNERQTKINAK